MSTLSSMQGVSHVAYTYRLSRACHDSVDNGIR